MILHFLTSNGIQTLFLQYLIELNKKKLFHQHRERESLCCMVTARNISFLGSSHREMVTYTATVLSREPSRPKDSMDSDFSRTLWQLISLFSSPAFVEVMLISGTSCLQFLAGMKTRLSGLDGTRLKSIDVEYSGCWHRDAGVLLSEKKKRGSVS